MSRQPERSRRSQQRPKAPLERAGSPKSYGVTTYDSELARLAVERNEAYSTLHDVELLAKRLIDGEHAAIGTHLLTILYGEESV